jgi:Protein of unknown function (DUF3365)
MNRTIVGLCCLWISIPVSATDIDALKQQSRAAVKALGDELRTTLMTSMQAEGPLESIGKCKLKAPEISERVSAAQNMRVARTSLKVRNSDNAPDDWEQPVLELFERSHARGTKVDTLEYAEIMQVGDKREFRYIKAIPTGDTCLACHGENLPAPLSEKLQSLYPNDQATGFHKGDIRGAFTVTIPLHDKDD